MSVEITYHEEGSIQSYIKVKVRGEDKDGDKVTVEESMTAHDLLKVVADLIDKNPYYKDIFDKRLF